MLLSSLAERVYWFARYVERVENTARIILVNNHLLMDTPKTITPGWKPIVSITGCEELFFTYHKEATERNVMRFLIMDKHNPNCMLSSLRQARENLRTSRVIFPREIWETLNNLYSYVNAESNTALTRRGRYNFLKEVIDSCHMISGKITATMNHDQTYDFLRLGQNIERADMSTRVIDVRANNLMPKNIEDLKPFEDIQWKSVLDSLAAYLVYRRRVHVRVRGSEVLDFLLKDKFFPRTVTYCLTEMEQCLEVLPSNKKPLKYLAKAQRIVKKADVDLHEKSDLNEFVDKLQLALMDIHEQLTKVYFQLPEEADSDEAEIQLAKSA